MALGTCGEITLLEVLCDLKKCFFNPYSVLIFMLLSVVSTSACAHGQVNMCDTKVGGRLGNVESGDYSVRRVV